MKSITEETDVAIVVKKESGSGMFKNERVLLIKSGFLSYFSKKPKSFVGKKITYLGTIRSIEISKELPKMTLSAAKVDEIERNGKYLNMKFNKKHLINISKMDKLVGGSMESDKVFDENDEDEIIEWNFKCESVEQAQVFQDQVMIYKTSETIKPSLETIISGYREGKKGPRPESMSFSDSPMRAIHRFSEQVGFLGSKHRISDCGEAEKRVPKPLVFTPFGLDIPPKPEEQNIKENNAINEQDEKNESEEEKQEQNKSENNEQKSEEKMNETLNESIIAENLTMSLKENKIENKSLAKQNIFEKTLKNESKNETCSKSLSPNMKVKTKSIKTERSLSSKVSSSQKSIQGKKEKNQDEVELYSKETFPYFPFVVKKVESDDRKGEIRRLVSNGKSDIEFLQKLMSNDKQNEEKSVQKDSKFRARQRTEEFCAMELESSFVKRQNSVSVWSEMKNKGSFKDEEEKEEVEEEEKIKIKKEEDDRVEKSEEFSDVVKLKEENVKDSGQMKVEHIGEEENKVNEIESETIIKTNESVDASDGICFILQSQEGETKIECHRNEEEIKEEEVKMERIVENLVDELEKEEKEEEVVINNGVDKNENEGIKISKENEEDDSILIQEEVKLLEIGNKEYQQEIDEQQQEKQFKVNQEETQVQNENENHYQNEENFTQEKEENEDEQKLEQKILLNHEKNENGEQGSGQTSYEDELGNKEDKDNENCSEKSITNKEEVGEGNSFNLMNDYEEVSECLGKGESETEEKNKKDEVKVEEEINESEVKEKGCFVEEDVDDEKMGTELEILKKGSENEQEKEIRENYAKVNSFEEKLDELKLPLLEFKSHEPNEDAISFSNLNIEANSSGASTPRFWEDDEEEEEAHAQEITVGERNNKLHEFMRNQETITEELNKLEKVKKNEIKTFAENFAKSLLVSQKTKVSEKKEVKQTFRQILAHRQRSKNGKDKSCLPIPIAAELLEIWKLNEIKEIGIRMMIEKVDCDTESMHLDCENIMFGARTKSSDWHLFIYEKVGCIEKIISFYLTMEKMIIENGLENKMRIPKIFRLQYKMSLGLFIEIPENRSKTKSNKIHEILSQMIFEKGKLREIEDETCAYFNAEEEKIIISTNPDFLDQWENTYQSVSNNLSHISEEELENLWIKFQEERIEKNYGEAKKYLSLFLESMEQQCLTFSQKQETNEIEITSKCRVKEISKPAQGIIDRFYSNVNHSLCKGELMKSLEAVYWYGLKLLANSGTERGEHPHISFFLEAFVKTAEVYLFENRLMEVKHICIYVIETFLGKELCQRMFHHKIVPLTEEISLVLLLNIPISMVDHKNLAISCFCKAILLMLTMEHLSKCEKEMLESYELFLKLLSNLPIDSEEIKEIVLYNEMQIHEVLYDYLVSIDPTNEEIKQIRKRAYVCAMQLINLGSGEKWQSNEEILNPILKFIDWLLLEGKYIDAQTALSKIPEKLFSKDKKQLECRIDICACQIENLELFSHTKFTEYLNYFLPKRSEDIAESEIENSSVKISVIFCLVLTLSQLFACNSFDLSVSIVKIINESNLNYGNKKCIIETFIEKLEPAVKTRLLNKGII